MPSFAKLSDYQKNAGYAMVQFGSDAVCLESELNEMQQIISGKLSDLSKIFSNGWICGGYTTSVSGDTSLLTFTITANSILLYDGITYVFGEPTSITVSRGSTIYLATQNVQYTKDSVIKPYGNTQSSSSVTNKIMDDRISSETSRRRAYVYTLSTTNTGENTTYIPLSSFSPEGIESPLLGKSRPVNDGFSNVYTSKPTGLSLGQCWIKYLSTETV